MRGRWIVALATLALVAGALGARGQTSPSAAAAPLIPIDEQARIMWQAVEGVLGDMDPAQRRKVLDGLRAVGIGSWMKGTAKKSSDIDITLTHPDPDTERRFTRLVNERIEDMTRGRSHAINVTHAHDFGFEDRFRGEVGQRFFYEYANETGNGRACFVFDAVEADGRFSLATERVDTARFWDDLGRARPTGVDGAARFLEDEVIFMLRETRAPALDRGMKAAKYLENYESRLKGMLAQQYGDLSQLSRLDAEMLRRMNALNEYKVASAADPDGAMRRLMAAFGAETPEMLDARMGVFFVDARDHLMRARDEVEFLETFARSSQSLDRAAAARALAFRRRMLQLAVDVPLGVFDLVLIYDAFQNQSVQAGLEATGQTLLSYGMPPAAIAVMLGVLAKEVTSASVTWFGKELIFDPINDQVLREHVFAPGESTYIFGDTYAKLQHVKGRETLACWYTEPDDLDPVVDDYVSWLKSTGAAWFATAGEGAIQGPLRSVLLAQLAQSQDLRDRIGFTIWPEAVTGSFQPIERPLHVAVNGQGLGGDGEGRTITVQVPPGGRAEFEIELQALFTRGRKIYPRVADDPRPAPYGQLWNKVCDLGYAGAMAWFGNAMVEGYRPGYPLTWSVQVDEAEGWLRIGDWPSVREAIESDPMAQRYGRLSSESFAQRTWRLGWMPEEEMLEGSKSATVTLTAEWAEPGPDGIVYRTQRESFALRAELVLLPAILEVHVTDVEGRVIEGALVRATGPGGQLQARSQSGIATLAELPPGEYRVQVSAEGFEPQIGQVRLASSETRSGRVRLERVVAAPPVVTTGVVAIDVIDAASGLGVPGGQLLVEGPVRRSASAGDGAVRIEDLPPGPYRITASAPGYVAASDSITVVGGETFTGRFGIARVADERPTRAEPPASPPDDSAERERREREERERLQREERERREREEADRRAREQEDLRRATEERARQCVADVRAEYDGMLASNARQDPSSSSVAIIRAGRIERCIQQYRDCYAPVDARYRACPPDSSGSYARCQAEERRGDLACATASLQCELAELVSRCEAGGQP